MLVLVSVPGFSFAAPPTIRWEQKSENAAEVRFVVTGLSPEALKKLASNPPVEDEWPRILGVFTEADGKLGGQPMLGDYKVDEHLLVFTPRFAIRPGLGYRAILEPKGHPALHESGVRRVEQSFRGSTQPATKATRLDRIFPTKDVLPENALKFYLHFSAAMSRGEAYQRIQLLAVSGKRVEFPFLELSEELWSPDGRRFTLYFDPGRIKRGLKPREIFGPALIEGATYTLVVDANWPDANGEPLESTFTKRFRVVAPDDKQPQPKNWKLQSPHAGTREPLIVDFDEPLDSAMLERVLTVRDSRGTPVAGSVHSENQEQRWRFEPTTPWGLGGYQLVVATTLEDVAGNSIGRPFEVDVFRAQAPPSEADFVELPFTVVEQE